MNPDTNALAESYARRTNGGQMPQQGAAPAQPTPQPAPQQAAMGGYSGGAQGVPTSQGPAIDPEYKIQELAVKALAKRLNNAGKVA